MTKRTRKKKAGNEPYFGQVEEDAVIRFLSTNDQEERNEIYNTYLKYPLDKMIESIIRKYKLYRKGESFEDLHMDTLSFLITKSDKFDGGRGKKAYSYYGTTRKNYLIGLLKKDEKYLKQVCSYEDISEDLDEKIELSYTIDEEKIEPNHLIKELLESIKLELKEDSEKTSKKMSQNERMVGNALIEILDNWESSFNYMGSTKYNKNTILEMMRNYTNLSTKDIRISMKRFKKLYYLVKHEED